MNKLDSQRRRFLRYLGWGGGMLAVNSAHAYHTESHFEDTVSHKIVYQCNKADEDYHQSILFSVGELLRKYEEDVHLVVAAFGPGIQILGKKPTRPVAESVKEKVQSLAEYGVSFHACGNTMTGLKWKREDIMDFAVIVPIGVDDIMQLQEQGFAYMAW